MPERAKVQSVTFGTLVPTREWAVWYAGEVFWFTSWRDAYDYAYIMTRLRNAVMDALGHLS